jgi:hypothetical protein
MSHSMDRVLSIQVAACRLVFSTPRVCGPAVLSPSAVRIASGQGRDGRSQPYNCRSPRSPYSRPATDRRPHLPVEREGQCFLKGTRASA